MEKKELMVWASNHLIRILVCVSHLSRSPMLVLKTMEEYIEDDSENPSPTTGSEYKGLETEVSKGKAISVVQVGQDTQVQ